jgi:nucleoside 2-deoxyribosyltransferase
MKIYIICPVRNVTKEQQEMLNNYVALLEKQGNSVYLPKRDAPQNSKTGYEIVEDELKAIKEADRIDIFWDINSKGSHFDLGMAYALNKHFRIVFLFQEDVKEKSYIKVIKKYSR